MTIRQIYPVKNNQVIIDLPESLKGKDTIVVTLDDQMTLHEAKLLLMQQAANDPLFLSDVTEVAKDFSFTDNEHL